MGSIDLLLTSQTSEIQDRVTGAMELCSLAVLPPRQHPANTARFDSSVTGIDIAMVGLHTPMMARHSGVPKHADFSPRFAVLRPPSDAPVGGTLMRGKRPSSALMARAS
jgi:hypothetical protein